MANVLELKIESTLDKAGIDAAKQGVQDLQASTGAAASAMSTTAGAASSALTSTGSEAGKTATAVKTVGEAAQGAAAGVQALSGATAQAASATAKLGTAAAGAKAMTVSAKGAATAMAGVGTAAAGAGNEAVSSLNLMSMGANILTGNIMGTIQASTELAGHFKGISMIKFSGVALAIAGIATAWQWVTKKIKEYNAALAKSDATATERMLQRLKVRYDEVSASIDKFNAAQARVAQNVDAFQTVAFDQARLKNEQNREAGGGGRGYDVRSQDIDNAERLYNARVAAARAQQEATSVEKAYQATVRATNSEIGALNDLYSKRAAMTRQSQTGSMGGKAYAEEALKALDAQIEATKQAVAEGRARVETLKAAKEQAPIEAELAERRLAMVEADVQLTAQIRERQALEEYQAERDMQRVELAGAVADAEAEVAAARERLKQAEDNQILKERTTELLKQADAIDKQTAEAKKLLGVLGQTPNRERALEDRDKARRREEKRQERALERQHRREARSIDNLASRAGGKAIFDPATGKLRIKGRDGEDLTHRLSKRDRERWARLAELKEAEAAQNNGQAAAARQLAEDLNKVDEAGEALAAVKAAEGVLEAAQTALVDFDSSTEEGLREVQREVAQWRAGASSAIKQAAQMSNQVVEKLTAATESQTSTLSRLLTAGGA